MIKTSGSLVQIFETHVTKEILSPEDEEPIEVVAAREAYLGVTAKRFYPYIPTVYSWEGTTIKMERVHGVRMDDYLASHPDRLQEVIDRVKKIVNLLLDAGIYHGDPAPRNLFMDENDQIWLIDFGSGQIISKNDNRDEWYQKSMWMFFDALEIYSPVIDKEMEALTLFHHLI